MSAPSRGAGATVAPVLLGLLVLLTACAGTSAAPAGPTVTIIERETVTVTATGTATATETAGAPTLTEQGRSGPVPTGSLPTFELSVLEDGCAVQRSEGDADGLTWSVRDDLGVQVLGRNALGETRYRYFLPGTWTVVLEAWAGDRYAPVSDEVTIVC